MCWKWMISTVLIIAAFSCKNKSDAVQEQVSIPEDFYAFYDQFHNDSTFQMEHIIFPLQGLPAEDSLKSSDWRWNKSSWVIHKPFDPKGTFKRDWYSINSIIIERISDSSGRFTMERRWAKMGSEWNLIFYKEMGT